TRKYAARKATNPIAIFAAAVMVVAPPSVLRATRRVCAAMAPMHAPGCWRAGVCSAAGPPSGKHMLPEARFGFRTVEEYMGDPAVAAKECAEVVGDLAFVL